MDYLFFKFDYPEIDEIKPCLFYYSTIQYEFKFIITTQSKYESRVKSAKTKDLYEKYQKDPLENDLIFFESFHGRYNNNPKYIYEKMLEMGLDKEYKIVWSYDGDEPLPGNPITVTSDDEDYYKYLAHAKYKISNATFPIIDGDTLILKFQHGVIWYLPMIFQQIHSEELFHLIRKFCNAVILQMIFSTQKQMNRF